MTTDILDQDDDLDAAIDEMAREIGELANFLNSIPKPFSSNPSRGRHRRYRTDVRRLHRSRS